MSAPSTLQIGLSLRSVGWRAGEPVALGANDLTTVLFGADGTMVGLSEQLGTAEDSDVRLVSGFAGDEGGHVHVMWRLLSSTDQGGYRTTDIVYARFDEDGGLLDEHVLFSPPEIDPGGDVVPDDFHDVHVVGEQGLMVWTQEGDIGWSLLSTQNSA